MTERHRRTAEETSAPVPTKRPWHPPSIEEIDYTATEAAGIPGANYDGLGFYSVP